MSGASDDWHTVSLRRTEEELRPRLSTKKELLNTPSRKDGIDVQTENKIRRKSVALIQEAGIRLELPCQAICTAIHFFHQFYVKCSLKKYSHLLTAQTCLFLASKVEETSRRIRDVMNTTYRLRYPDKPPLQVTDTEGYWQMKDTVVRHEQLVLRVLGFNMSSRHPHHYALHFLQDLNGSEELAILTWSLLNDSLRTTLCLQYKPEPIACAAIYLAAEMMNHQMGRDGEWWHKFGTNRHEIEDICMQMLNLYEESDSVLCEADMGNNVKYKDIFSEKNISLKVPADRKQSRNSKLELQ
mmetsp:Transcript_33380/g.46591  ORF Transcript_33380/g.46591 Transcript_33380/m.46591 type:complete len:298 (+) Transcript_33380:169-1062(+)